jgi:hypothetical protein
LTSLVASIPGATKLQESKHVELLSGATQKKITSQPLKGGYLCPRSFFKHTERHTMAKLAKKGSNKVLTALVDELGELKSRIAELELREKDIKSVLCESGETLIKGYSFQASISESERCTLDSTKVKTYLTPVEILACQRITTVVTVRVSARSE